MGKKQETVGEYVRRIREEQDITLRTFAKMIDKTPTYISRFERGDAMMASEESLRVMARVLAIDVDDLIFRANKVPADLPQIVQQQPVAMAALLRTAQNLTGEQIAKLTEQARKQAEKGNKDNKK